MSDASPAAGEAAVAEPSVEETAQIEGEDESFDDQVRRVQAVEAALKEKEGTPEGEVQEKPEEAPEGAPGETGEPGEGEDAAAELAKVRAELEALKSQNARESVIRDAGLPVEYARLIGGDKESWKEQVDMLLALKGRGVSESPVQEKAPVSVPRDPAIDADYHTEDNKLAQARNFFGLD